MAAHCYFLYNVNQSNHYTTVKFKLFDDNYISYVTYDNTFLVNEDSWRKYDTITYYSSSSSSSICDTIKDPFQERISCTKNINNCMYCENENTCQKCKYGFALFNEKCLPSTNFENNLRYFTSDNGTSYYSCSSKINDCEECSYNEFLFNKFHCSKCTNGYYLNEIFICENKYIKMILIGISYANYFYNKILFYNFYVLFEKIVAGGLTQIFHLKTTIKYIKSIFSLRNLQDSEIKESICVLVDDDEFEYQKRYNCTLETSGEEIESIELDKNIEIKEGNFEVADIEFSPIAIKQMSNILNITNEINFTKKLYTLDNSTTEVDNDKNIFNITGYIEDNNFYYTQLDLDIYLRQNISESLEKFSCDCIKNNDNKYTLKCYANKSMNGQINSCFANLGDSNLIISFLDGEKKNLNFEENHKQKQSKMIQVVKMEHQKGL